MLLVVKKAFLVFGKVFENRILPFIHIVKPSWFEFFTWIFVWVLEIYLEVVLKYLALNCLASQTWRWHIHSPVESDLAFLVHLIVRLAFADRLNWIIEYFEKEDLIMSLIVSSLLIYHPSKYQFKLKFINFFLFLKYISVTISMNL